MAGPYSYIKDAADYVENVPNKLISLFKQDDTAPGDYTSRLASIARQQKLAEALSQMGNQEQAVYTAGGITAPMSPMGALARGLTSFGGSYLAGRAAGDEAALRQSEKQKRLDFLANAPGSESAAFVAKPTSASSAAPTGLSGAMPTTEPTVTPKPAATYNQKRDYFVRGIQSDDPAVADAAEKGLKALEASQKAFARINPKDYTVDSIANFTNTGEVKDLVAKPEGVLGKLFDDLAGIGFDTKDLSNNPAARRIINGFVAKNIGGITEDSAATLAVQLTNAGISRATELRQNPSGTDVPSLPPAAKPFDLFAGQPLNAPPPTTSPVYTLPPQPQAQPPVVPRPPMNQPSGGAPMRQAAPTASATMPSTQAPPTAAPQQGGAPMFGWQKKGFVPLVLDQTISPMKRQDLKFDQPTNEKSVRTSVGQLDSWAKAGIDLLNDPGFERISGLVGSNLKDISKEAISASAKYKQIENIAKGFSVQSMKEASKTGATSLGQITMGEYPMLRDMAGLFLSAGTAPAKRAALSDFVNKLIEIRNNKLGEYNSTYPALSYQPPAYAPFGGIKQPRSEKDNQETLDLINQYHRGR